MKFKKVIIVETGREEEEGEGTKGKGSEVTCPRSPSCDWEEASLSSSQWAQATFPV